jgi:hypothetical protein
MAPSNLQGLNIVHPPQEFSDSQDLLAYPELSAQLDLWSHLTFDSDETYAHRHGVHDGDVKSSNTAEEEEEEEGARSPPTGEKAIRDGHTNVVTPTNVVVNQPHNPPDAAAQSLDLNSFLAAFAIERYGGQPSQLSHLPPLATSMAQLLALPNGVSSQYSPLTTHPNSNSEESFVPVKGARTRKASITTVDSPNYRDDSVSPSDAASNSLTPSEDKRRRNTAASARFRLKKKEREAALEGKAKELETKVTELERECEGLRRENGWLRGLVVGVTGAAQGSNASLTAGSSPPAAIPRTKRRRVESESI